MKKLKLNLQQFEGAEVLTRSQLKKVLGGGGGDGTGSGGNCQALVSGNEGGTVVLEGMDASTAQNVADMIHWCCDSCCTATWAYHNGC
jgi:hypothetical protein